MRDLTLKDLEGIKVKPNCNKIDILVAVSGRALVVYDEEKKKEKEEKKEEEKEWNLDQQREERFLKSRAKPTYEKPMNQCEIKVKVLAQGDQGCRITKKRSQDCQNEVKNKEKKKEKSPNLDQRRAKSLKKPLESSISSEEIEDGFIYKDNNEKKQRTNFKKQRKTTDHDGPNPPPGLPIEFKNKIKELAKGEFDKEEILVIQKPLCDTDVKPQESRFSIPSGQIMNYFLYDEEEAHLKLHYGKRMLKEIRTTIIEPLLGYREVFLKRWLMKKDAGKNSMSYVLNHSWNGIVTDNELKSGQFMQLWAVRVRGKLWLALVRLEQ